jgi:hypothetical protein
VKADAFAAMDMRWSELLECDPFVVQQPGIRWVERENPNAPSWLKYEVPFFALLPELEIPSVTISAGADVIEQTRHLSAEQPRIELESELLTTALLLNCDAAYIFDILVGWDDQLRLTLDSNRVREMNPNDEHAVRWDGRKLEREVDGPVFATYDDAGMTSWAGIKRTSSSAQDLQVGTREDAQRQGLARLVTSHAVARIMEDGKTPYYSHLRDNDPSKRFAESLGFIYYGSAILAENEPK